jgi:FAD/FMN-containing dehydrogenase
VQSIREDLKQIVGLENILESEEILDVYSKDHSLCESSKPEYVVKPVTANEIKDILILANKNNIPVTPVSSGIHFYGNTIPNKGGFVLDLRRMNKILDIDLDNKMVRIEPGVTWGQLQEELAKYNMMALIPLLPHSSKSVLTSCLEREPMLIPKYEYAGPLVTSEVVFPEGSIFRTGSSAVPGFPGKSLAEGVNPGGPGFYSYNWLLQGAQGTLGIVTWAKIKIAPKPGIDKTFVFSFNRLSDAAKLAYNIQKRMIGEECLILNNNNYAGILSAMGFGDYQKLKEKMLPWILIIVSGGGWRRPEEKIEYEEEGINEAMKELQIDDIPFSISGLEEVEKELPSIFRKPSPAKRNYWKFAEKGECDDIFFHTTLNKAEAFENAMKQVAAENGYSADDIGFYIQPLEYGRACHFEVNFTYNAADPIEVNRMKNIHQQAALKAIDMGGFFPRPYGIIADMVFKKSISYTAALKEVKKMFDPNDIMSPGRLGF